MTEVRTRGKTEELEKDGGKNKQRQSNRRAENTGAVVIKTSEY